MEFEDSFKIINSLEDHFDFFLSITLFPIGILLNIISIFVFRRKKFNKTKMGIYYTLLSITHTVALLYYLFIVNAMNLFNYNPMILSDFACKVFTFLRRPARQISAWIQVSLTIHRFISFKYPNKSNLINNTKAVYFAVFLALLSISIFASGCFLYQLDYQKVNSTNSSQSIKVCSASSTVYFITEMQSYLFRIFIPFVLIAIMSVVLYANINKGVININNLRIIKREHHFTYTCYISNLFYLVINAPILVLYMVKFVYFDENNHLAEIINSVWLITNEFSHLYYSTFFIWNIIFNSLFRHELSEMLKALFKIVFNRGV